MAKNILLVVEGDADEPRFFNSLYKNCFQSAVIKIYPYKSNIHVLAQVLYSDYPHFEEDEIDIRLVLSSLTESEDKKKILRQRYTDIFIVFDFDPHHDYTHFDTVRRMLTYFRDSTAQGKLYINYPMMQSYKHFSCLPDDTFLSKKVNYSQIKSYKEIVGSESSYTDLTKYNYRIFYSLSVHHLKKINYLLHNNWAIPTCDQFYSFDMVNLFDFELSLFQSSKEISVVNTSILVLCEYAPEKYFRFISQRSTDLLI